MITEKEIQALYVPWNNQRLQTTQLSKNVCYLGYFTGFGEVWARRMVWQWDRLGYTASQRAGSILRSQEFQEKSLDASLAELKNCLILSTTPTYFSQYQNACLLKSRGFQLLEDSCYLHPGYPNPVPPARAHPGIPDRQEHYEHIWWKIQGPEAPRELGCPGAPHPSLNNCGVDGRNGLVFIKEHDISERQHYMAVGWLPRGTPFPDGWKRFYSGDDYKLGHNILSKGVFSKRLNKVQKCPHNFDLEIFKDWMPNLDEGAPT